MSTYYESERVTLLHDDCVQALSGIPESSVDSCVTDPPYELTQAKRTAPPPEGAGPFSRHRVGVNGDHRPVGGFMGKQWDGTGVAFRVETWAAIFRVLKPGAHLLAFGGTRTHHRMVCAIEDAGFEIRDEIDWIYSQGFPKSLNFDGAWDGWGTALKPAKEPICLARKPLAGTVEENLIRFGCGALNVDACRVGTEQRTYGGMSSWMITQKLEHRANGGTGIGYADGSGKDYTVTVNGRWPANLIHDGSEEVLAAFPNAKGQQGRAKIGGSKNNNIFGDYGQNHTNHPDPRGDTGSAARFFKSCQFSKEEMRMFYCAKASKSDREEGCDHLPVSQPHENVDREPGSDGLNSPRAGAGRTGQRRNNHPTVKPTELMRYLCRLITPPSGLVLDPFTGSGSTGKAALAEGFRFIGIEREEAYCKIAAARLGWKPTLLVIED